MGKYKSPSSIRCRNERTARLNRLRKTSTRTKKKAELCEEFGIPTDSKFLFLKKGRSLEKPPLEISYGTVVCFDDETQELLLVARFHKRTSANEELLSNFNDSISLLYKHAQARSPIDDSGAASTLESGSSLQGRMYAIGFRAGLDKDSMRGVYSLNPVTSETLSNMEDDLARQLQLPKVKKFVEERFSTLSLHAYHSNLDIALESGAPSFDSENLNVPQDATVFGSNFTITVDGFGDAPHSEDHATKYSIGFFASIDRSTGALHVPEADDPQGKVEGAKFMLDDYNFLINYDDCDGVVEQVLNTRVRHHTPSPTAYDSQGAIVPGDMCAITRFGSSCQIPRQPLAEDEQSPREQI